MPGGLTTGMFVLMSLSLAVMVSACGSGDRAGQRVLSRATNSGAAELVLNAELPPEGFGEFPNALSLGPDIRTSLLAVQLLEATGGVPHDVRVRLTEWVEGFVRLDGWVTDHGPYEDLDVAILVFRLSTALDSSASARLDAIRIATEASQPAPEASAGSRVARMAWAREAVGIAVGADQRPTLDQLDSALAEALAEVDPQDIRDAAGLSQAPTSLVLAPTMRAEVVTTLRQHRYPSSGAWSEHVLGLHMLGEAAAGDYSDAFIVSMSLGAPTYWGRVGPLETLLLVAAPENAVPGSWAPRHEWQDSLRAAILHREAWLGGFHPPVAAVPTVSATVAAAIALYHAGADSELSARMEVLRDVLCEPEDDGNDPLIRALMLRHAYDVLELECELEVPPYQEHSTILHASLRAYLSSTTTDAVCPPDSGREQRDFSAMLLVSMALEESDRAEFIWACLSSDELVRPLPPVSSVYELYAMISLRVIAGVGLDPDEVDASLSNFRRGSGYGDGKEADLGSTCQALVIHNVVENYRFIPVFCVI